MHFRERWMRFTKLYMNTDQYLFLTAALQTGYLKPFLDSDDIYRFCRKLLLKSMRKKEKLFKTGKISFSHNIFNSRNKNQASIFQDVNSVLLIFIHWSFNPFPYIDAFWHLCNRRLLKLLWQKKKLLMMSNFSICHNDFNYTCIFNFKVVCCRFIVCGKGWKYHIR